MPPDYTRPSWNVLRDMEATRKEEEKTSQFAPCVASRATVASLLMRD